MNAELLFLIVLMGLIGSALGTFTGLVPGIHVNMLAALMLSFYPLLETFLGGLVPAGYTSVMIASCIVSAAVVHSSVDFVPSVFLGAPDPDEVLNILPGHRLLMEGRGMTAVRSAAIGSAVGSMAAVLLALPIRYIMSSGLSDVLERYTAAVIVVVIFILIVKENGSLFWAVFLTVMSGILGIMCMSVPVPDSIIPDGSLLFPMLTGLFGIPAMILSAKGRNIPEQRDNVQFPVGCGDGLKGVLTGGIVGWFPGITATAGASVASSFSEAKGTEGFISLVASIGSVSAVFALITLSVTGKGRSGTMLAVRDIMGDAISTDSVFMAILLSVAVAVLVGYCVTIYSGKVLSRTVAGKDLGHMNFIIIIVISVLVFLMTGVFGIFVLAISTILGLVPTAAGVGRVHLTGCLTLPVLIFYLGLDVFSAFAML